MFADIDTHYCNYVHNDDLRNKALSESVAVVERQVDYLTGLRRTASSCLRAQPRQPDHQDTHAVRSQWCAPEFPILGWVS